MGIENINTSKRIKTVRPEKHLLSLVQKYKLKANLVDWKRLEPKIRCWREVKLPRGRERFYL